MRREAKQSSVLSPAIFNNVIGCVTGSIPHFLIELSIDPSHLSYADDILLLSDNMQSLQAAVNSLYAGLSDIGLSVASAKTEFLVLIVITLPIKKFRLALVRFLPLRLSSTLDIPPDLDSRNKVTNNKCAERR